MERIFKTGKLPVELLEQLLSEFPCHDPDVVVGPSIGEDAAVIDTGDAYIVVKSDPITFATDAIGYYAIMVNANDIVTMGAKPRWFLATILLPEGMADPPLAHKIFEDLHKAASSIGVSICGGHTEITAGIDKPIVSGMMLGTVKKDALIRTSGARAGDVVILTKGIAIEATAIIAREKEAELRRFFPADIIERAKNFLFEPGISIVKDALVAMAAARITSMHDPTEGGLSTGLYEMAKAANVGMEVHKEAIKVYPESRKLLSFYGLNPLGAISSGALLLTTKPEEAGEVIQKLSEAGVDASVIGRVTDKGEGLKITEGDCSYLLPKFDRDEIARIFEE